jgi:hypothetical protein
MAYISVLSTIITFIFTAAVFNRYRAKGGAHLLLWGIGLSLYGLGTLMESLMLFTFSAFGLKLWYLSGAMLTAAWLGQGSLNLLVRRRGVAASLNVILALVSLVALAFVVAAPVTGAAASYNNAAPLSTQYKDILTRSGWMIFMTIILNLYGTVTLVGGALYSAFIFWRKRVLFNRMIGNILIAAGALFPAIGGSFVKAGLVDWLYLSELAGVLLMYVGFVQAIAPQADSKETAQAVL